MSPVGPVPAALTGPQIAGIALLAAAGADLLLAFFLAFVRPLPDERARKVVPAALVAGAIPLGALGVAFLGGVLGGDR